MAANRQISVRPRRSHTILAVVGMDICRLIFPGNFVCEPRHKIPATFHVHGNELYSFVSRSDGIFSAVSGQAARVLALGKRRSHTVGAVVSIRLSIRW